MGQRCRGGVCCLGQEWRGLGKGLRRAGAISKGWKKKLARQREETEDRGGNTRAAKTAQKGSVDGWKSREWRRINQRGRGEKYNVIPFILWLKKIIKKEKFSPNQMKTQRGF